MSVPSTYLLFGYSTPINSLTMTAPDGMVPVGVVKPIGPEQIFRPQLAPTDKWLTTNFELTLPSLPTQ